MSQQQNCMVAYIFDSGKFETYSYGKAAIGMIVKGKELQKNQYKIIVSVGDVLDRDICVDISPYVIFDDLCSIYRESSLNPKSTEQTCNCVKQIGMKDFPFVVILEDVEKEIVQNIDVRLQRECKAYIGVTTINTESVDQRKQFWKNTIRAFSLEWKMCTVFDEMENGFAYEEEVREAGYKIQFDGFGLDIDTDSRISMFSTRQSSFIQNLEQLEFIDGDNDSDRGILKMNFALVKEVEIAGVQIWKAIEDINRVYLTKDCKTITVDYIFTSFYQAAQGTERLLKILVELVSYIDKNNEKRKTDELLHSHSHIALIDYLERKNVIKHDKSCRKLLDTLANFYNHVRYSRYIDSSDDELELSLLNEFGSTLKKENYNDEFKKLYGKILGKTSRMMYKAIDDLSSKLGIYVSELNTSSVACIVFWDSYQENIYKSLLELEGAKKEILWYLIDNGKQIKDNYPEAISSLSFDSFGINDFITEMIRGNLCETDILSEISEEYDVLKTQDNKSIKIRLDFLSYLFSDDGFTDHFHIGSFKE